MSASMRAKMKVQSVTQFGSSEQLKLSAVSASSYPDNGSDEDNTYAKFSPTAELTITIANPALIGKFAPGETYYVDFTPAQ